MKKFGFIKSLLAVPALLVPTIASATEATVSNPNGGSIAIAAGIAIGLAAIGGTLGQGKAVSSGLDAIGRNPSAEGKIKADMMLGLAFVESLVIISFVVAYLLLGKI